MREIRKNKMKKLLLVFNMTLIATLFFSGLSVSNVQAKQDRDRWTKVHADWPGYGYYKVSPNGIVHEKWACDENWRNCAGSATYYPMSKFKNPVTGTPCGEEIGTISWEGTVEYQDDQADVSDFLIIGKSYWFCDALGGEIFRGS
jgi:hypothetical protein